jgi:hypothetical protein
MGQAEADPRVCPDRTIGRADCPPAHPRFLLLVNPRRQGNGGGHGKLSSLRDWIETRIGQTPDLTLNDLVAELADQHGLTIHRVSVWRFVRSLGLTHKKRPPGRAIVRHWFKRNGGRAEAA